MIILSKETLENNEAFSNAINNQKALINSTLENQKTLKNILLDYMQKLVDYTDTIDFQYADTIINLLSDFKNSLELFNTNRDLLDNLLKLLNNITLDTETINFYNTTFIETNESVSKNTLQMEKILHSIIPYLNFTFYEPSTQIPPTENKDCSEEILESTVDENLTENVDSSKIIENTLIISETKGKIFLPYTYSSLNDILQNNSDKYSSIEDIIEKDYTLPFDLFKNPVVSRFREAFKLIRIKEKKSIKEAFDLGMELLFNYNLHPAIITACKTLDELDIYLDYLENNETHKFDCFKIVFEVAPIVVKNHKKS